MVRMALATIIICISLSLVGCKNSDVKNDVNTNSKITMEQAKEIALEHANLTNDQVTFISTETEIENGVEKYDIEFYNKNKEYDYEINAADGQIINCDHDVENYNIPNEQVTNENANANANTNANANSNANTSVNENASVNENISEITVEEAKEIALKHANLKSDQVTFEKAEIDFDNGVRKYEIEFIYKNKEYDYEINAADGKIINYDYDAEYNNKQETELKNSTSKISKEKAKEIALKHANLKSNQVTFEKVEIDVDDGVKKYDLEFYYNNKEYDYEIDANTGDVLSFDVSGR